MTDKHNKIIKKLFEKFSIHNINIAYQTLGKKNATFNSKSNTLIIANNKKSINNLNFFIKLILHEIDHILMYKKYGVEKFENMYKLEIKRLNKEKKHYYNDNKFERQANIFMENNLKKCIRMFGDL